MEKPTASIPETSSVGIGRVVKVIQRHFRGRSKIIARPVQGKQVSVQSKISSIARYSENVEVQNRKQNKYIIPFLDGLESKELA